jgi:hypothetical protein
MMNFLIDYNLTGDAVLFWGTLSAEGWLDLLTIRFFTFQEVGLPMDSSDRVVWQFAQTNQMILITANRNMKGDDSLEQTIREENREQVKAEEQINYLTKASIGYGIEKRVGKRQK